MREHGVRNGANFGVCRVFTRMIQQVVQRRLDQRQALDTFGILERSARRDMPSIRMADQMGWRARDIDHRRRDLRLVGNEVQASRGPVTRPAVAEQVGREHAIAGREPLDRPPPLCTRAAGRMQKHDTHAVAGFPVMNVHVAHERRRHALPFRRRPCARVSCPR